MSWQIFWINMSKHSADNHTINETSQPLVSNGLKAIFHCRESLNSTNDMIYYRMLLAPMLDKRKRSVNDQMYYMVKCPRRCPTNTTTFIFYLVRSWNLFSRKVSLSEAGFNETFSPFFPNYYLLSVKFLHVFLMTSCDEFWGLTLHP